MPRRCTVCEHRSKDSIDRALVMQEPFRHIASQYGVSTTALQRHGASHLVAALARAKEAREAEDAAHAIDIVKQLKIINQVSLAILAEARAARDPHTALKAVDRIQRQGEMQARLLGQIDDRPQVNVLMAPEWLAIRSTLLAILGPYPEARAAVAQELVLLEAPNGHR